MGGRDPRAALDRRRHANHPIPPLGNRIHAHVPLHQGFERLGDLGIHWNVQTSVLQVLQPGTEVKTQELAQTHCEVGVSMRVDRELAEICGRGLAHHALDSRASLIGSIAR